MSTSDPLLASAAAPQEGNWTTALHGSQGLAPGIVSPAQLARMANEMFHALPDEFQPPATALAASALPPNSAFSGNPYSAVPSPTAPAVPGMLAGLTEIRKAH